MKKLFVFLIVSIGFLTSAQQGSLNDHSKLNINCKTCHTCDVPTKNDPCLVFCPRENIATIYQKPEETPELIVINELKRKYGPVYFSHKIHAQMSTMSGGCENCHHHNTSGPILKCNNCHDPVRKRNDVSLPDLKGAFHRQCMDCHREWSHSTGCNTCHLPIENKQISELAEYQKSLKGKSHPTILEPTKIVYETSYEKGKLVTFYHDDHTIRFSLSCISCHEKESCTKCHDVNNVSKERSKIIKEKKSLEEHHKKCFTCHEDDNCLKCHSSKQLEPFNHAKATGWSLNKYHSKLSCSGCHKTKSTFKNLDKNCMSCHTTWLSGSFDHKKTGLELDEIHTELSCEDCHNNNNFEINPECNSCHDDYQFPKQKPGKLIVK